MMKMFLLLVTALREAQVGLGDTVPRYQDYELEPSSYRECAILPGEFGHGVGATHYVSCRESGRYVIVQLRHERNALMMCEVRVFGSGKIEQTCLDSTPALIRHPRILAF
jgi:hypothetical protein